MKHLVCTLKTTVLLRLSLTYNAFQTMLFSKLTAFPKLGYLELDASGFEKRKVADVKLASFWFRKIVFMLESRNQHLAKVIIRVGVSVFLALFWFKTEHFCCHCFLEHSKRAQSEFWVDHRWIYHFPVLALIAEPSVQSSLNRVAQLILGSVVVQTFRSPRNMKKSF